MLYFLWQSTRHETIDHGGRTVLRRASIARTIACNVVIYSRSCTICHRSANYSTDVGQAPFRCGIGNNQASQCVYT